MSLLAELRRRNVIRMAGLYLVGAWLIVQVAGTLLPVFEAPAWVMKTLVGLLAVGFVPALIFSWVFELTPSGIRRDAEVSPGQSIAPQTARRMDRTIIVVLVLALGYFAADKFVLGPRRTPSPGGAAADAATVAAPAASKSIAVLPFTDLSPEHDQEYFSDGMAEELLNALVRVKDLKVAGRTSSFYYRGRNEDLRAIGKALGVANVLEGSVRKQGDKVRITAQLVRSDDGFHLWSETFDGDLKDVFELQERIARAITGKLAVVLSGDPDARLVQAGTRNSEAYSLYLQATATFNKRDYPNMRDAIGWLEEALVLDPGYARGHARLALIHVLGKEQHGSVEAEGERHAREAMALDPKLAEPHIVLGLLARHGHRFLEARVENDRALALEPDDASTNLYAAQALIMCGYTRQGVEALDRTLALDPILPQALNWRGMQYTYAGDLATGERLLLRAGELGLTSLMAGNRQEIARRRGEFAKAIDAASPSATESLRVCSKEPAAAAASLLRGVMGGDAAARSNALTVIDACLAAKPAVVPSTLPRSLIRLGQPDRALALLAEHATSDDAFALQMLWNDEGRGARESPAFAGFARKFGFAELWDRYGPPDLCERRAPGDYVCR